MCYDTMSSALSVCYDVERCLFVSLCFVAVLFQSFGTEMAFCCGHVGHDDVLALKAAGAMLVEIASLVYCIRKKPPNPKKQIKNL